MANQLNRDRFTPAGECSLTTDGLIIDANQATWRLLGVDGGAGQPFSVYLHPQDQEPFGEFIRSLFENGEAQTCEGRLLHPDGAEHWAQFTAIRVQPGAGNALCRLVISDISERKFQEDERELSTRLVLLINTPGDFRQRMQALAASLQGWSGCEAIGIRLHDGDDYPYYETRGFPAAFVRLESRLCSYGPDGQIERDFEGNPVLECMCGNVLQGRFDPSKPFFTGHGSFWTNGTTALLASTTEADRQARTRNRCNGMGYESVALIPLRTADQVLGLLQFNDHRPNRFTAERIAQFERLAGSLAIALARYQAETALQTSRDRYYTILQTAIDGFCRVNRQGRILEVNDAYCRMSGYSRQELLGMSIAQLEALEAPAEIGEHIVKIIARGEDRFETRHRRKDGSSYDIEVAIQYHPGEGEQFVAFMHDISRRKQSELALRESEARFSSAFEYAAIGKALVSPEGRWLKVNQATCDMLGYTRAELLNKTFQDITHPDDLEADLVQVQALLRGEIDTYQMQKRYFHKSGAVVWALLSVSLMRDPQGAPLYFISQIVDITERKRAEDALRQSQALLNTAQRLAKTGGWEWDVAAQTMTWTEEVYRIHELEPGEAADNPRDLMPLSLECYQPSDRPAIYAAFQRCISHGEPYDLEFPFTTRQGRSIWIRTAAQPVIEHGRIARVIGHLIDITERKQAEETLQKQYAALQSAQARLVQSEKLAAIGELVSGVAHELNNPLTSIVLYSQLMEMKTDNAEMKADLEKVLSESNRAARIVRGLLDFARQRPVELRPVQINTLIQECLELVAYQLRTHNIRFETQLEVGLPLTRADPHQLQQVLLNLIQNAQQAIQAVRPTGRLCITSASGPSVFRGLDGNSEPVIRVSIDDDGPGVPAALLSRIFDPFFTTKDIGAGTGLGLAICHGIVAEHSGHIWVENRAGGGARFIIELPALEPNPPEQDRPAAAPGSETGANSGSILIIDDETSILDSTARTIEMFGYRVTTETDGQTALNRLRQQSFDLVISDIRMPGLSGGEIYRSIQLSDPALAKRMLFITGDTVSPETRRFLEETRLPCLEKPFEIDELLQHIQQMLEKNNPLAT